MILKICSLITLLLFSLIGSKELRAQENSASLSLRLREDEARNLPQKVDIEYCRQRSLEHSKGPVADAQIWLENESESKQPTEAKLAEVDIEECEFDEQVKVVRPGQKIKFSSDDPILYQLRFDPLFSRSFSYSLPPNLSSLEVELESYGPIEVYSTLHPWMRMLLIVDSEPSLRSTNQKGEAEFLALGDKTSRIHLWHPVLGFYSPNKPLEPGKDLDLEWPQP